MISLTSEKIVIDRIKIDSKREPDEEVVRQLMLSIPVVGLLQPIVLTRPSPGLGIKLVFGLSRLTALRRLKETATLARVVNGNTDEIKAWIKQAIHDENLIRRLCALPPDSNVVSLMERRRAAAS